MSKKVMFLTVILTLMLSACSVGELDLNVSDEYEFEHIKLGSVGDLTIQGPAMEDFNEGLCAVCVGHGVTPDKESKMALMDAEGNMIVQPGVYDSIYLFTEGLAAVGMRDENTEMGLSVGFIDKEGNLVVPIQYEYVSFFVNGMAIATPDRVLYGIINQKGEPIVPIEYDYVRMDPLHDRAVVVGKDEKYGLINRNGSMIVPLIYDWIGCDFTGDEDFYSVKKDNKWGFINTKGELIIPLVYDLAGDFHEGLACVGKKGDINYKIGFIDPNNKIVIPFEYDLGYKDAARFNFNDYMFEGFYFEGGVSRVYKGKEWGFIDRSNHIIIPFGEYDEFEWHNMWPLESEGPLFVSKTDSAGNLKYGAVARSGSIVAPVQYDELFYLREGGIRFKQNEKFGFMDDTNGEIIVPAEYDFIEYFNEGLARFEQNGKWGYMDAKGKIVIPDQYLKARPFREGIAWVLTDDGWELLKKIGSEKQ